MPLLFAYGTLRDASVQRALFGRQLDGRPDTLRGVVRGVLSIPTGEGGGTWPNLVCTGRPADVVHGEVFALSDAELAAADAYETSAYVRHLVTLGSGARAWVYVGSTGAART